MDFEQIYKWAEDYEEIVVGDSNLYLKDYRRHYNKQLDANLLAAFIKEVQMSDQSAAYYDVEDDPIVVINQRLVQENIPVVLLGFNESGIPVFDKPLHNLKSYINKVQAIINGVKK